MHKGTVSVYGIPSTWDNAISVGITEFRSGVLFTDSDHIIVDGRCPRPARCEFWK